MKTPKPISRKKRTTKKRWIYAAVLVTVILISTLAIIDYLNRPSEPPVNRVPASGYFSFSEVGAEAEIISATVIRIRILHFNITAIGGNATGLNIFTAGMSDPTEFASLQLANGTSKVCDIQLPSRLQVIKKESVFPVTINLYCQEAEGDVTLGIPPEMVFPS